MPCLSAHSSRTCLHTRASHVNCLSCAVPLTLASSFIPPAFDKGAEALVLDTLDWSALSVGVLIVECSRVSCSGSKDLVVSQALTRVGFRPVAIVKVRGDIANLAFVNASNVWVGSWGGLS